MCVRNKDLRDRWPAKTLDANFDFEQDVIDTAVYHLHDCLRSCMHAVGGCFEHML